MMYAMFPASPDFSGKDNEIANGYQKKYQRSISIYHLALTENKKSLHHWTSAITN